MLTKDKIETNTAIYYIQDGILIMRTKKDADMNLEAAKEGIAARKKLQGDKKALILVDNRNAWQVSNEAREYAAQKEIDSMNIAMAILADSITTRMIGNFYINFNKPKTPTKMFKSEAKALEWLETFR